MYMYVEILTMYVEKNMFYQAIFPLQMGWLDKTGLTVFCIPAW